MCQKLSCLFLNSDVCKCVANKHTSSLLKRRLVSIISCTIGTNYQKKKKIRTPLYNNVNILFHFSIVKYTMKMTFTFLTLLSICLKQSVKRIFLTPSFSSLFKIIYNMHAKVNKKVVYTFFKCCLSVTAEYKANILTCLLDRSARSILFRTSRCGLAFSAS